MWINKEPVLEYPPPPPPGISYLSESVVYWYKKAYENVSCLWYVVAGDFSPLFVCASMHVCVSCFRCVAGECIDVFRGPWEAHTGASCSFICCSWRNAARESSQTELSKAACHSHEVYVSVYGAAVCVLLFHDCPGLQAFFFFMFSSLSSCTEENVDQANTVA